MPLESANGRLQVKGGQRNWKWKVLPWITVVKQLKYLAVNITLESVPKDQIQSSGKVLTLIK